MNRIAMARARGSLAVGIPILMLMMTTGCEPVPTAPSKIPQPAAPLFLAIPMPTLNPCEARFFLSVDWDCRTGWPGPARDVAEWAK